MVLWFKVVALFLLVLLRAIEGQASLTQANPRKVSNILVKLPQKPATKELWVETKWFRVEIASEGGHIRSFFHRDLDYALRDNIALTDPESWPMQVYFWPNASREELQKASYELSKRETPDEIIVQATLPVILVLEGGKPKVEALFEKTYAFRKNQHFWRFTFSLATRDIRENVRISPVVFYPISVVGPAPDEKSPRSAQTRYAFVHEDGDFHIIYLGQGNSFLGCSPSSQGNQKFEGKVDFFGLSSRFMMVGVQPTLTSSTLHYFSQNLENPQLHLEIPYLDITPGKKAEQSFIFYTGPKVGDYLSPKSAHNQTLPYRQQLHKDLYKGFDFGITAPIRDLIVLVLDFFYRLIPNYGVGIILFALLFKVLFYRLNQKQAESMKKMSDLQPKIQEINEKYRDNPQEKNRRLMLLYQEHKINPMGGCLPILIQIPIFIALYSAFSDSYELWKSPFIRGWVDDLSEPDIVYVIPIFGGFSLHLLPILMTLTQFLQTKLTMFTGDENQRRLMLLMPFLMLVFFWSMPSGVVLYWTVQNILSILQQLWTNFRTSKAT
ncbi:MAG: YidC/Oxa1 family insertase periplasmic-domain containing protein [Leptospiraceae bacterium]|nr:YidC/Oxa1 family insertase periplasmic-domain containing protein [Leptospiraceae bacterium]MDW8306250.1 YidC/Oxa1 family insertase periplasmic-domain containing protein [Leptospiraceae bacterium]